MLRWPASSPVIRRRPRPARPFVFSMLVGRHASRGAWGPIPKWCRSRRTLTAAHPVTRSRAVISAFARARRTAVALAKAGCAGGTCNRWAARRAVWMARGASAAAHPRALSSAAPRPPQHRRHGVAPQDVLRFDDRAVNDVTERDDVVLLRDGLTVCRENQAGRMSTCSAWGRKLGQAAAPAEIRTRRGEGACSRQATRPLRS